MTGCETVTLVVGAGPAEERQRSGGSLLRRWMAVEYHCCSAPFFEHIVIIIVLVLFAGLMSGLTLGLMSLSLVDLEVLAKSGTEQDRKHAGTYHRRPSGPFARA